MLLCVQALTIPGSPLLPACDDRIVEPGRAKIRAATTIRRFIEMAHPHILLVEDEHLVLDVLDSALAEAGFKISRAPTTHAALEFIKQQDVHLLMTDIKMPGSMDGVELAGLARQETPQLPVIFLSGNLDGLANSDRLAPPTAFLVKPVDVTDAINTIDLLISGESGSTEVVHNRAASGDRQITQRPTGTPTSDRHATETAHSWEDEQMPVRQPRRPTP
jgi:two-component system, response regulator PdtaR